MTSERLPRHERADTPPRMRLTERDIKVVLAVYDYRVLKREQIQGLFFPSKNTANDRLNRLYQQGFLERRWLPVEQEVKEKQEGAEEKPIDPSPEEPARIEG